MFNFERLIFRVIYLFVLQAACAAYESGAGLAAPTTEVIQTVLNTLIQQTAVDVPVEALDYMYVIKVHTLETIEITEFFSQRLSFYFTATLGTASRYLTPLALLRVQQLPTQ